MSDATLWRYIGKADDQIAESCRSSRKKRLRRHIAQRRNLYAKALGQGDIRTALAAADSEAKLLGLYPAKGIEVGNVNVVNVEAADDSPKNVTEIFARLPTEHVIALMQMLGQERPTVEVVPLEKPNDDPSLLDIGTINSAL